MTEPKTEYQTPNTPMAVTKTYSLDMERIAKVADMSDRSGDSQGQVVRSAIDLRWEVDQAAEQLTLSPDELQAEVVAWLHERISR